MSTKHNNPHPDRSKSRYKIRLKKRGMSKAPTMTPVEVLRKTQDRRVTETCTVGTDHEWHACNGQPWWTGREITEDIFAA